MHRYQFTQWSVCSMGSTLFSPRSEPSRLMPPSALYTAFDQSSRSMPLSPLKRVTLPALFPKFVE